MSENAVNTQWTQYDSTTAGASNEVQALPEYSAQQTTSTLAAGASTDFDFNISFSPIFDMFVYADVALTVRVFVRQSSTDTFRQLGADIAANAAGEVGNPLSNRRLPGEQVRIRLINNSGSAATSVSAQVQARSL
jgi:hypothetical protein